MPKKRKVLWIKCIFCQRRDKECPEPLLESEVSHKFLFYKGGKKDGKSTKTINR